MVARRDGVGRADGQQRTGVLVDMHCGSASPPDVLGGAEGMGW